MQCSLRSHQIYSCKHVCGSLFAAHRVWLFLNAIYRGEICSGGMPFFSSALLHPRNYLYLGGARFNSNLVLHSYKGATVSRFNHHFFLSFRDVFAKTILWIAILFSLNCFAFFLAGVWAVGVNVLIFVCGFPCIQFGFCNWKTCSVGIWRLTRPMKNIPFRFIEIQFFGLVHQFTLGHYPFALAFGWT